MKILRTASLGSNFTGFYKKKVYLAFRISGNSLTLLSINVK